MFQYSNTLEVLARRPRRLTTTMSGHWAAANPITASLITSLTSAQSAEATTTSATTFEFRACSLGRFSLVAAVGGSWHIPHALDPFEQYRALRGFGVWVWTMTSGRRQTDPDAGRGGFRNCQTTVKEMAKTTTTRTGALRHRQTTCFMTISLVYIRGSPTPSATSPVHSSYNIYAAPEPFINSDTTVPLSPLRSCSLCSAPTQTRPRDDFPLAGQHFPCRAQHFAESSRHDQGLSCRNLFDRCHVTDMHN